MTKLIRTLLPSAFLALSSILSAQSCTPCENRCVSCGPDCEITPSAGPCIANGADIFLTGEFIYWTVRQDHLGFAATNEEVENVTTPDSNRGSVFHPDWNFSPGFKVGLGIWFDCDGWDLYANYTWLRVRNTREKATASQDRSVVDLNWAVLPNNHTFTETSLGDHISVNWVISTGKWENDFNVIDLELGRNFFISPCLQLRPHFGLKGTWQKQRMDVDLFGTPNPATSVMFNASGEYWIDYWGVGIRAGLDTAWHFTPCFSFFGEIAASTLWECFESDAFVFNQNLSTGLYAVDANFRDTFHTIKPVLELIIGLRWENWFCCDEYHWSIEAGWEEQWWANQNQFISPYNETRQGDFIAQGLTLKLRFDF